MTEKLIKVRLFFDIEHYDEIAIDEDKLGWFEKQWDSKSNIIIRFDNGSCGLNLDKYRMFKIID